MKCMSNPPDQFVAVSMTVLKYYLRTIFTKI